MSTPNLVERLKIHEGFRNKPYLDTTGNLSIGYGHKMSLADKMLYSDGITIPQAELLLDADIEDAEYRAETTLTYYSNLDTTRKGVIIEMLFNLGLGGFLKFRKVNAALDIGDYKTAASEMLNSKWWKQVGKRAEVLAQLMLNGDEVTA